MTFAALQQRHEALLARQDEIGADHLRRRTPAAEQLYLDAQQFVTDAVAQSEGVTDPRQRDLLRAYLRYWSTFLYDWSGVFPKTELRPANLTAHRPVSGGGGDDENEVIPTPVRPGWVWAVAGLLGFLLLLAAAAFLLTRGGETGQVIDVESPTTSDPTTPLPPVTRTPLPSTIVKPPIIAPRNAGRVTEVMQVEAHTGGALDVAFDPAKPEIATAGADGVVRFWVAPTLSLSRQLNDQRGWVRTVAYSPDEDGSAAWPLILTGGNDRVLRSYDLESLQLFAEFVPSSGNSGFVFAAAFRPDGRVIASGHGDGVARIWDVGSGTEDQSVPPGLAGTRLAQIPSGATAVNDVAFRDGDNDDDDDDSAEAYLAMALGGTDFGVQVMDPTFTKPICAMPTGAAGAVVYSPGGELLAAGLERGAVLLMNAGDCRVVLDVFAHEGGVTDIAFSPTGEWLVTSGRDGTIKIWSPDGKGLATLAAGAPVEAVAVDPGGYYIASADAAGRLILWGVP